MASYQLLEGGRARRPLRGIRAVPDFREVRTSFRLINSTT